MKPSPRTRREAILLLDVAASQPDFWVQEVVIFLDAPFRVHDLVNRARAAIASAYWNTLIATEHQRASAAGLLRDGWSPGDPVVKL